MMESCFNPTRPLQRCSSDENNRIYDFSPENVSSELSELDSIDDSRNLKKVKSIRNFHESHNTKFNVPRKSSVKRRNRKPVIKLSSLESPEFAPSQYHSTLPFSDTEFSFTSTSDSDMDLESLPDLVDDNNTPISSPKHPVTPSDTFLDPPGRIFENFEKSTKKNKVQLKLQEQLESSSIIESQQEVSYRSPSIFEIPEIVHKIIEFASIQNDNSPKEVTPMRRRPLSFKHALLIHGNKELAKRSMEDISSCTSQKRCNVLYNCLSVNRLFNAIANEILSKKFYFNDEYKLARFLESQHVSFKPTEFKLHKLFNLRTHDLECLFPKFNVSNLQTIEVFMCPRFLPPEEFYHNGHNIKKIGISGSKILDDNYLMMIGKKCPNLEVLDIRGCELVTDAGVYHLGKNCTKLTSINLGRKVRGHLITDAGVHKLITNNKNLVTVGLAGCYITDKTIWDLTINNSTSLERLSINNCPFVTNQSIPLVLHADYLPNLNVLEIRFTKIDNLKSIIEFKRRQEFKGISILIELCESLCLKMRQQEVEMDKIISQRIFNDIQDWANDENDGDSCYHSLLSSRSVSI